MNMRLRAMCIGLFSLTACSDDPLPPEPPQLDACATIGACEVRGADLIIDELALAFPTSHPRDAETGLPWVQQYDSVPVRYRVRNRGDESTVATTGRLMSCDMCGTGNRGIDVLLPALAPGAFHIDTARVPATMGAFVTSRPVLDLDFGGSVDEPFYRNNRKVTAQAYLAVAPDVRGSLLVLSPEVRIGSSLRMVLTLRNHSRHAILRADSVAFCFRRTDTFGLDSCHRPFGMRVIPTLGPGQQWQDTIEVQLTRQNYLYERHNAIPLRLDACLGGRTSYATEPCAAGADVTLRPDLETACALTTLTVGVPISDAFGAFDGSCYIYLAQYEAYGFDAHAGKTYQVQVTSEAVGAIEVGIWNRNGEMIGLGGDRAARGTVPADGKYYVVLRRYSFDSPGFDLIVREVN